MPDLAPIPVPPELSILQVQLAQSAVISELGIPGGLRRDDPITSPLSQYMHDCREVLAQFPPTLETQQAAQYLSDATHVVPKAETAEPETPIEPEPAELVQIDPDTGSNQVPGFNVKFIGGPFDDTCVATADGVEIATTYSTVNELYGMVRPAVTDAESTVSLGVRQGEHTTAELPFTFTHEEPETPPLADQPASASAAPLIES